MTNHRLHFRCFVLCIGLASLVPACGDAPAGSPTGGLDAGISGLDAGISGLDAAPDLAPPPSCTNHIHDGLETDIDCGGNCPPCDLDRRCMTNKDCQTIWCAAGKCATPSCNDGAKNGMETDVDCGGPCPAPCGPGGGCATAHDCRSGVCTMMDAKIGVCAVPLCNDGVKNGTETDVDCGGRCAACGDGKGCMDDTDCVSQVCSNTGVCQVATCKDFVQNGLETDLDCGGGFCPGCIDGGKCKVNGDCQNGNCTAGVCAAASCMDKIKDGMETDLDCGGGCIDGKRCKQNTDCHGGYCKLNLCATALCNDRVPNGAETDVDCGGGTCPACADGKLCKVNQDCQSSICKGGTCVPPSCTDQIRNGTETDVDCGGGKCSRCFGRDQGCAIDNDCQSGWCHLGKCDIIFLGAVSFDVDQSPVAIVAGVLNADGKGTIDLATANHFRSSGTSTILRGDGKGGFTFSANLIAGGGQNLPAGVAIADFNGDSKNDLAVSAFYFTEASGITVFTQGMGGALAVLGGIFSSSAYLLTTADFNGDGRIDIAAACYQPAGAASVILNNKNMTPGRFFGETSYATGGSWSYGIAAGDLNGDGRPDLVLTNEVSNDVSVLLNNGMASLFAAPLKYVSGTRPRAVAIGDIDGDTKPDIVAANSGSGTVSVFINNGNGTFKPALILPMPDSPTGVALGDFNRDGKLDIATANNDGGVGLILNRGNVNNMMTTQSSYQMYLAGAIPNSLVAADFNADGKLDLAVANTGSNNVSILLNNFQ